MVCFDITDPITTAHFNIWCSGSIKWKRKKRKKCTEQALNTICIFHYWEHICRHRKANRINWKWNLEQEMKLTIRRIRVWVWLWRLLGSNLYREKWSLFSDASLEPRCNWSPESPRGGGQWGGLPSKYFDGTQKGLALSAGTLQTMSVKKSRVRCN